MKSFLLDPLVKPLVVSGSDRLVREVGGLRKEGDVGTQPPDVFVHLKRPSSTLVLFFNCNDGLDPRHGTLGGRSSRVVQGAALEREN